MFVKVKNRLYKAKFDNPVIIEVYGYVIRLFDLCIIHLNVDYTKIELQTGIKNNTREFLFVLTDLTNSNNVMNTANRVNQAIEDTYKPGGYMYTKSEQIVKELTNKT